MTVTHTHGPRCPRRNLTAEQMATVAAAAERKAQQAADREWARLFASDPVLAAYLISGRPA